MTPLHTYESLPDLMTRMTGDEKHSSSATSTLDVLWVLYDRVLRVDPQDPESAGRDRFFLSKGHGPMAYYAVLAAKGFFPVEWLDGFGGFDSPLGWHPDRTRVPGVEISSGSLGHGLGLAVGAALAAPSGQRIICMVGDAELDEGSNHEAIAFAGRRGLDGLTVVVVDNNSASHGWPGGIGTRFAVEGWHVEVVDGRDHRELEAALSRRTPQQPTAVIAAVEGKQAA